MSGRLYQRITTSRLGTTRRAGRRRGTRGQEMVVATRHDLTRRLPDHASRPTRLY